MSGVSQDPFRCAVLVIGAGPGGASAAYVLARAGVDVILADRVSFPRDKPCGDGLTPYCAAVLDDMGAAHLLIEQGRPYTSVIVHKPDQTIGRFDIQLGTEIEIRPGYVLPRIHLDNALVELARASGARLMTGFVPVSLIWKAEINSGNPSFNVTARWEGRIVEVKPDLLIIATGANRRLLQRLGLSVNVRPTALGLRVYMGNLHGLEHSLEFFLDEDILPGYGWVFPTGDVSANVGVGVQLVGRDQTEGVRLMFAAFRRLLSHERLTEGVLISRMKGYPIYADYPLTPTSFPGGLIVGEAAGLVDPITREGLSPALNSGHLAALTVVNALRSSDISLLQEYAEFLNIKYGRYFIEAQEFMRWLGGSGVIRKLIACAGDDSRVAAGLDLAVRARRPGAAQQVLMEAVAKTDRILSI